MNIRIAKKQDADSIVDFNMKMAMETEGKELDRNLLAKGVSKVFDNPSNGFYVAAENGDGVVGSMLITYEWSDWRCGVYWWIQSLYIVPEHRRKGIFSKMYEFIKDRARQNGDVVGCRLYVEKENTVAQSCYENLEFYNAPYHMYEIIPWVDIDHGSDGKI